MSIRHTLLAVDKEVSRFLRKNRFGRGLAAFGMTVVAVVFGTVASAAPVLSFDSVQVTADGTNPTPVSILVKVDNTGGPALTNLISLSSQLIWTASGGPTDADISTVEDDGTASTPGMLFATTSPFFDMDAGSTEPKNWGIANNGTGVSLGTVTQDVATLNFTIAPGVTSGQFSFDFVTGSNLFNVFGTSTSSIAYANGNNGTGTGVITVVPEASSSVILASGALVATGVGFAQRRARRNSRRSEIAG